MTDSATYEAPVDVSWVKGDCRSKPSSNLRLPLLTNLLGRQLLPVFLNRQAVVQCSADVPSVACHRPLQRDYVAFHNFEVTAKTIIQPL